VKRRSIFYWLAGILIAAVVIAIAFYVDGAVRDFVVQHQNRTVRNFMRNVSRFGDWPEHFALGLILAGVAWWRGNKRWTRIFLSMLAALAVAGLIGHGIKISTGRARPSVKLEQGWNGPRFSSKFQAFPSGHVAASTAFFAVLFLANWRIGLACVAIPILIGISRMYVAAHYLSDVVCAAVLGILCALLIWCFVLPKIENRQSKIGN
jgi:membrane-associated phospholipid phosphatase